MIVDSNCVDTIQKQNKQRYNWRQQGSQRNRSTDSPAAATTGQPKGTPTQRETASPTGQSLPVVRAELTTPRITTAPATTSVKTQRWHKKQVANKYCKQNIANEKFAHKKHDKKNGRCASLPSYWPHLQGARAGVVPNRKFNQIKIYSPKCEKRSIKRLPHKQQVIS